MASKVHIEFQRVQTWLFAVPRLRAMVGANALLGAVLRDKLPALARSGTSWKLAAVSNSGHYPKADKDDPLSKDDDPAADAADGIVSRDGGHFEAVFGTGAAQFAAAAELLLRTELPGLRFRVSIDGVQQITSRAQLSTELPVLAPCEWTGRGLASALIDQGADASAVSLPVKQRHVAASKSKNDLASLLSAQTTLCGLNVAQDLAQLAGNGYMALIHADGNGVGGNAGTTEHERAKFFHRNRVLLRRALKAAIDSTLNSHCSSAKQEPLVPLMLGGDDLLVVCQAKIALPFVVALCEELKKIQHNHHGFTLTLGVGVVFARHTIPIHRLHEVAEQLASSAKRRYRGLPPEAKCSVVDWSVYTTAWIDDPDVVRQRHWLCGTADDVRVLSQRPIDVLGSGFDTLQGLIHGSRVLEDAPRSQLRFLVDQLPLGRKLSCLAFEELSEETRRALDYVCFGDLWQATAQPGVAWTTAMLDLVEVTEIARLGRANGT